MKMSKKKDLELKDILPSLIKKRFVETDETIRKRRERNLNKSAESETSGKVSK